MAYLNKEGLLIKLAPFGINSMATLNRVIREHHLPTKYISPRKTFFDEAEVEIWLSRRYDSIAKANATQVKIAREQRKKAKKAKEANTPEQQSAASPTPSITTFKAKEA